MSGAIELGALSVALAMDAAAVSAGLGASGSRPRTLWAAALLFGLFQAGMAGLGALGGAWLATHAAAWDHWLAFGLLTIVGGRMVLGGDDGEDVDPSPSAWTLLVLAVATSIDALAAGVSVPLLGPPLPVSLLTIGVVTVVLSGSAAIAGARAGAHLGSWAERLGGVVLIGIGVRVLIEHLG